MTLAEFLATCAPDAPYTTLRVDGQTFIHDPAGGDAQFDRILTDAELAEFAQAASREEER